MPQEMARELVGRRPTYEFRAVGNRCTTCGAIIGNARGDDRVHDRWHQALAMLLGGGH